MRNYVGSDWTIGGWGSEGRVVDNVVVLWEEGSEATRQKGPRRILRALG